MPWRVVIRRGSKVEKLKFPELGEALEALEGTGRHIAGNDRRDTIKVAKRTYEDVGQVMARIELRGPGGLRAGVDIRGDGSSEAYTGRWKRELIEQQPKEDAFQALRREIGVQSTSVDP